MARIERDAPGVFRRCLNGEYSSVRQAAFDAGIVKKPVAEKHTPETLALQLLDEHGHRFSRELVEELAARLRAPKLRPRSRKTEGQGVNSPESDTRRQFQAEQDAEQRRLSAEADELREQQERQKRQDQKTVAVREARAKEKQLRDAKKREIETAERVHNDELQAERDGENVLRAKLERLRERGRQLRRDKMANRLKILRGEIAETRLKLDEQVIRVREIEERGPVFPS